MTSPASALLPPSSAVPGSTDHTAETSVSAGREDGNLGNCPELVLEGNEFANTIVPLVANLELDAQANCAHKASSEQPLLPISATAGLALHSAPLDDSNALHLRNIFNFSSPYLAWTWPMGSAMLDAEKELAKNFTDQLINL